MDPFPQKLENLLKRIAAEKEVFQNDMLGWTKDYLDVEDPGAFTESYTLYSSKPDMIKAVQAIQAEDLGVLPKYQTSQTQEVEELLTSVYLQDRVKAEQIVDLLFSQLEYRRRERPFLESAETYSEFGNDPCP